MKIEIGEPKAIISQVSIDEFLYNFGNYLDPVVTQDELLIVLATSPMVGDFLCEDIDEESVICLIEDYRKNLIK